MYISKKDLDYLWECEASLKSLISMLAETIWSTQEACDHVSSWLEDVRAPVTLIQSKLDKNIGGKLK